MLPRLGIDGPIFNHTPAISWSASGVSPMFAALRESNLTLTSDLEIIPSLFRRL
jgi:hypothetical protein